MIGAMATVHWTTRFFLERGAKTRGPGGHGTEYALARWLAMALAVLIDGAARVARFRLIVGFFINSLYVHDFSSW